MILRLRDRSDTATQFFIRAPQGCFLRGPRYCPGQARVVREQSLGRTEKGAFGSSPTSASKGCCRWTRQWWGSGLNALSLSQPRLSPWWMPPPTVASARHPLQGAAVRACSLAFCRSLVCVPPRCLPSFPGVVAGGWRAEPAPKCQRRLIPELRHDRSHGEVLDALWMERL